MGNSSANVCRGKIGVLDSGVGGLTVVKELARFLPQESIVYYGDNGNCPYGNRTEDQIVSIAHSIIDFLCAKGVKAIVLACNTTSSLVGRIAPACAVPVFDVISPVCGFVAQRGLPGVGVIATELTIRAGGYERLIKARSPNTQVLGEPSRSLAKLVDSGTFDMPAITAEVNAHVSALTKQGVRHIIYGCTHYPIVADVFEAAAPEVEFLDPAQHQARAVQEYLTQNGLLSSEPAQEAEIYTTGGPQAEAVYREMFRRLGIQMPATFACIPPKA